MKNKRLTKTAVLLIGIMLTFSMAGCATAQGNTAKKNSFIEMVKIESGTFFMGSPPLERNRGTRETQHEVTLTAFSMGKYPVTQGQYEEVMGYNPSNFKTPVDPETSTANRPVEGVTWFEAVEFCNKLSEREKLTPVYTISDRTPATGYPFSATVIPNWNATGYRLPTEAQWEYACRAGTLTVYNAGSVAVIENEGWYSANSDGRTHPVGEKPANVWGLYDINGNVWEWCWDMYSYDHNFNSLEHDPTGADSGNPGADSVNLRVKRGGAWNSDENSLRPAHRYSDTPLGKTNNGFRVVRPQRPGDQNSVQQEPQQQVAQQPAQQQPAQPPAPQQPDPQQLAPPHPPAPQPAPANPAQPYTLVGTWYANIPVTVYGVPTGNRLEIYTFNSDGTGTTESRRNNLADGRMSVFRVGGMSAFRWTVSGNRITFTILNGDPDSINYRTYTISGNTLTLTIDDKQLPPYTRAQPQQAPTTNQPPPIGTWRCDSNPMVYTYTFNSDGTGTYRVFNGYSGTDQTSNLTWSIYEDWLRTDRRTGNNRSPVEVNFNHYSISGNELCFGYFQQIYIRQ